MILTVTTIETPKTAPRCAECGHVETNVLTDDRGVIQSGNFCAPCIGMAQGETVIITA